MGVGVTSIRNHDRRVNIPCSLSLIPYPLFFSYSCALSCTFCTRQKIKYFIFMDFSTLAPKNTEVGALLPLRARAPGSGVKPHSLQLLRNQRGVGDPSRIGTPPMPLGYPARIVVQSRKAGLKPNLAI